MRKTADAVGASKTGLINGVVVGQGVSQERDHCIQIFTEEINRINMFSSQKILKYIVFSESGFLFDINCLAIIHCKI